MHGPQPGLFYKVVNLILTRFDCGEKNLPGAFEIVWNEDDGDIKNKRVIQ